MVEGELDLTYVIIWSLALANILGAGACLCISPLVARLTTIRYAYLAPFMITAICFAAFQAQRDIADLIALFAIGLLGIVMKRFGWPRAGFSDRVRTGRSVRNVSVPGCPVLRLEFPGTTRGGHHSCHHAGVDLAGRSQPRHR